MPRARKTLPAGRTTLALVACAAIGTAAIAHSAELLGTAVDVRPPATGRLDANEAAVVPGASLFEGQVLSTGPEGEIAIEFTDGTRMLVGPNAIVVVERYLLQNDRTVGDFAVNAVGGTFRFLAGSSPSAAYRISTPSGTLGIRGTEFDFWFNPETRNMGIMLYSGAVELCAIDGPCIGLDQRCDVGIVGASGPPGFPVDAAARVTAIETNFPYVTAQDELLDAFRVDDPASCLTMEAPRTQATTRAP